MPQENEPVSHKTFGDKFGVYVAIEGFLTSVSLLLLIAVLIAWTGLRSIGATFGLAVRTLVEGVGRRLRGRAGCRRLPCGERRSGPAGTGTVRAVQ
jgi:hypothetical protein